MQYDELPDDPGGGGVDGAAQITEWYERYLGRTPSEQEIAVHLRNPNGLAAVLQVIMNSSEAKARAAQNQQAPTDGGTAARPTNMAGWQQWFSQLTNGKAYTPESLRSLSPELEKMGVKVLTNASGVSGKIQLPDGTIVDVIRSAGLGGKGWQWNTDTGSGSGAQTLPAGQFGDLMKPYGQTFDYPDFQGTDPFSYDLDSASMPDFNFQAPQVGKLDLPDYENPYGSFVGPTEADLYEDPSYKVRFAEGQKAIDSSAAARGNLLSGGTLKALAKYGQDQASKEFQNVYNRRRDTWGANTDEYARGFGYDFAGAQGEWDAEKNLSDTAFNQAATGYGLNSQNRQQQFNNAFQQWDANQNNQYRDWLANLNKNQTQFNTNWNVWNTDQNRRFGNLYNLYNTGYGAASQ